MLGEMKVRVGGGEERELKVGRRGGEVEVVFVRRKRKRGGEEAGKRRKRGRG